MKLFYIVLFFALEVLCNNKDHSYYYRRRPIEIMLGSDSNDYQQDFLPSPVHYGRNVEPGWLWVNATNGRVPNGSFVGGRNLSKKAIYVARALVPDGYGLIPGRLDDGDGCAHSNYKGRDVCITSYDVLNGNHYIWVKTRGTVQHPERVLAGHEGGVKLYVCRSVLLSKIEEKFDAIGKVNGGKCWISPEVAGQGKSVREWGYDDFELLIGAVD